MRRHESWPRDRWTCDRGRRQPRRLAGRRCCRPRAAVHCAEGRHRGDRRLAHRQGRGRSEQPVRLDPQGNVTRLLPEGQSSGEVVVGWLPKGRLALAFGTMSAEALRVLEQADAGPGGPLLRHRRRPRRRGGRAVDPETAGFEPVKVGGVKVGSTRGGRRPSRSRRRRGKRRADVAGTWIGSPHPPRPAPDVPCAAGCSAVGGTRLNGTELPAAVSVPIMVITPSGDAPAFVACLAQRVDRRPGEALPRAPPGRHRPPGVVATGACNAAVR